MNLNFDKSQKLVLILIIFGIISRIIPHPPNFSPVTAIALFGGLNFSNKKIAFIIPLLILIISDFFLGFSLINIIVYISFILVVFIGTRIKKISIQNILLSSFIFFLVSNFGVWVIGYPMTLDGLILCYTMAIPFFGYSIAGDIFFGFLFSFSFSQISSHIIKEETI
tara:strand:+ start:142 stop:642 length:501 start_codon:yes stop_codon:yes gene_type:complete